MIAVIDQSMIRSLLVESLYKNLLGPSKGAKELIEEPYLKYELGILNSSITASADRNAQIATESEIMPNPADIAAEDLSGPSDPEMQNFDSLRREVDTDPNFKVGTVSLGLRFVLKGTTPVFKVCVTWGRYVRDKEFGTTSRLFRRHPNFFVTEWIAVGEKRDEELENGINESVVTHPGACLHIY